MSDKIIERNVFERKVEKLLLNKPERYKNIIQAQIDRHLLYAEKINEISYNIDLVISYMVKLDQEYISIREDNG